MIDFFDGLLELAKIKIYECSIDYRNEMTGINRNMPFYVMSYLKQGEAILKIYGKEYHLKEKDVILVPAGVPNDHIKVDEDQSVFMWWHFDFMVYNSIDMIKIMNLPLIFNLTDSCPFEKVFDEYIEIQKSTTSLKNIIFKKAKELEIMSILLEAAEIVARQENILTIPSVFNEMLETIVKGDLGYISLIMFSKKFNMHPTYISNQFKNYFGISPIALHRNILIERAKTLLLTTNMTVSQIAEQLEFKDLASFSRFFIKKVNMSPVVFKNHQLTHS